MAKLSNGEKRELQLRYRFKQLKRIGKIAREMSYKEFTYSEYNEFTTFFRKIKYTKPVVKVKAEKLVSYKTAVINRENRRAVRHFMLIQTQKVKKSKREAIKYIPSMPCKAA